MKRVFEECWKEVCDEYKRSWSKSWTRRSFQKLQRLSQKRKKEEVIGEALGYYPDYAWSEADLVSHLACKLRKEKNRDDVFVHQEVNLIPEYFGYDSKNPEKSTLLGKRLNEYVEKMTKKLEREKRRKRKIKYRPRADIIFSHERTFSPRGKFDIIAEVKLWESPGKREPPPRQKLLKGDSDDVGDELWWLGWLSKLGVCERAYLCILNAKYADGEMHRKEIENMIRKQGVEPRYYSIAHEDKEKALKKAWDCSEYEETLKDAEIDELLKNPAWEKRLS